MASSSTQLRCTFSQGAPQVSEAADWLQLTLEVAHQALNLRLAEPLPWLPCFRALVGLQSSSSEEGACEQLILQLCNHRPKRTNHCLWLPTAARAGGALPQGETPPAPHAQE